MMHKQIITLMAIIGLGVGVVSCGQPKQPTVFVDGAPQLNPDNIATVIEAMTLEEKVNLVIGSSSDQAGPMIQAPTVGQTQEIVAGAAGTTHAIPRLGIPSIVLADGPAGLRISPTRQGTEETFYCTAFPIATLLASSWNTELIEEVGKAMGNEVLEYGCDVLLAPGMNIHRNPLNGRNFEYYSEDPLLTGKMAAAMTRGVQFNGVGVSLKHYAGNNQETSRMGNDAQIPVRALREIYLKGFETAVKEGNPWTVMSSYNQINGEYTSQSKELLTTILRDEWGFDGMVMTDWYGGVDVKAQIIAGNDLMMPGRADQVATLIEAVNAGTVSMEALDACVAHVLGLVVRSPRFAGYKYSNKPDLLGHALVTRQSAAEGMVLLENDGTLPFTADVKNIAIFGNTSYRFIAGGTGSGDVNEAYTISLEQGLANAGYTVDANLKEQYEKFITSETEARAKKDAASANVLSAFLPKKPIDEYAVPDKQMSKAVKANDLAIITLGRNSGEFYDRKEADDFLLTTAEKELIDQVKEAFHAAGKKVVVVLNIGGVIETASWKEGIDAILLAWQGGQEGGNAVADILSGAVNPSGRLTMTFPVALADHPSTSHFPLEDVPLDFSAFIGGEAPKRETMENVDYTKYEEDIFVGYRAFEYYNKMPSYAFGYGLSYTTFEYGTPVVSSKKGVCTIELPVTNTGKVAGKEVVEVYVAAPEGAQPKPVKELRAFAKTQMLEPGTSQTLTFVLDVKDLGWFNEELSAWVSDTGVYTIFIGPSSENILTMMEWTVDKGFTTQTNDVMHLL